MKQSGTSIADLLTVEALSEPRSILCRVFYERFHYIPPYGVRVRAARIVRAFWDETQDTMRLMAWPDALMILCDQAADTLFWELANRAQNDTDYLVSNLPMDDIREGART